MTPTHTLSPGAASYSPWRDAAERHPDIHIQRCSVPLADAAWIPEHRVILIEASLDRAARKAVLAHELAHIDLGHQHADSGDWKAWKIEVAADKLAARRLLSLDALADAARVCRSAQEVAEYLEVTLPLVKLRMQTLHPAERHELDRLTADVEDVA